MPLPDADIAVVRRADGSGTTFIFTNYLSKVNAEWKAKVGEGTAVNWPTGAGGKGNEGVSAFVQRLPNSIGYVEYAYAKQNKMTYTLLKNKDGNFVAPDDLNFKAAAAGADWAKTFYQILTEQPGKDTWPITGATFILMHKAAGQAGQRRRNTLKFFDWAYDNGDKMAEDLDYVPLPDAREGAGAQAVGRDQGRLRQGGRLQVAPSSTRAGRRPDPLQTSEGPMAATLPARPLRRDRSWSDRSRGVARRAADGRLLGRRGLFACSRMRPPLLTLALLAGIIVSLVIGAWPAIQKFGLGFLWHSEWDPVKENFGGLVMIYGTLMTSFIALLIAVPVSFGIALFLTELSPAWLKRPLGIAIELLAAVPSIVYGMWGLLVFGPILATYVQQPLQSAVQRRALPRHAGLRAAGGHRHPVGRHHPGDHDHSVHRLGDARRVRGHAADAQGVGLRAGLDDLGGGLQRRAALHQDRRRSAASCWAWAARSARRWR